MKRLLEIFRLYDSEPLEILGGLQMIMVAVMNVLNFGEPMFYHDNLLCAVGILGILQIVAVIVDNLRFRNWTNALMVIMVAVLLADFNHEDNGLGTFGGFVSVIVYNAWAWVRTGSELSQRR